MNDFEKQIAETFKPYDEIGMARLAVMPIQTRVCGSRNGVPLLLATGKGPWDVVGFLCTDGRMIGAELKQSVRKTRLPIVGPDRSGDGVQYHQLGALADLAEAGGVARILWANAGEVGILGNERILEAWSAYEQAFLAERSGRSPARGSKSIPWERFEPVEYGRIGNAVGHRWLEAIDIGA